MSLEYCRLLAHAHRITACLHWPPLSQSWAHRRGGVRAALALPEAPPEGPLRDALAAVLRQRTPTRIAYDLG